MGRNLSSDVKRTQVQSSLTSTAATDPASSSVDMQSFGGVRFIGMLGTAGSTDVCTLAVEESATTGSTTFTAITGATQTSTAGNSDKNFDIDVYRPRLRYVRTQLTRSGVVEYGGTIALQYGEDRNAPVVNDRSTALSTATPVVLVVPQTT